MVKFFDFIQELYNFFSVSTHRWDILKEHLDKNNTPVVKSLSVTRWSARADALKAFVKGYKTIQKSLIALTKNWKLKILKNSFEVLKMPFFVHYGMTY